MATDTRRDRYIPPKGKARLLMVKIEMAMFNLLLLEETALKFNHCQTDSLITVTLNSSTPAAPKRNRTRLAPPWMADGIGSVVRDLVAKSRSATQEQGREEI